MPISPLKKNNQHSALVTFTPLRAWSGGGGGWHKASASGRLPLAAPIGLSPLHILTLCGSERVLVVSTEPLDALSCLGGGGGESTENRVESA